MKHCKQSGVEIFDNEEEDLFAFVRDLFGNDTDIWLDTPNAFFLLETPRSAISAGGQHAKRVRDWSRQVIHGMPS